MFHIFSENTLQILNQMLSIFSDKFHCCLTDIHDATTILLIVPKNVYSVHDHSIFLHSYNLNILIYIYLNFCANVIIFLQNMEENKFGIFTGTNNYGKT